MTPLDRRTVICVTIVLVADAMPRHPLRNRAPALPGVPVRAT
jgi:hypothetical protein